MAHGEYVTFQDADDISMPERIERQLERAQELSGRRVVGCSYLRIENGVERPIIMPETHTRICRGFNRIFLRDTIVSGLILAPKLIFEKFPYQENLRYMEDWDHILKLYESGDVEFYNCQELLYKYFVRKKGVIFNPAWLNYNIFVRHCQLQRRNRLPECESLEAFEKYLAERPIERMRWYGLKQLISIKLYLYKWYRFNSRDS